MKAPSLAGILVAMLVLAFATAHAAADYRLGPGDLLKISTFGYDDLTTEARVSESGNITFPLIGQDKKKKFLLAKFLNADPGQAVAGGSNDQI